MCLSQFRMYVNCKIREPYFPQTIKLFRGSKWTDMRFVLNA